MSNSLESLLSDCDPVHVENKDGLSPVVIICEHAGRLLPKEYGLLGISEESMASHIAWDIGAASLSTLLAQRLNAPLIMQRYSRLFFDCNRSLNASDAMVTMSDNVSIPGNKDLSNEDRCARHALVYQPFFEAINGILDRRVADKRPSIIISIHSFTGLYKGERRNLDFGIIHDSDSRLADAIISGANDDSGYLYARNEPYSSKDGVTHTLLVHGIKRGIPNVMLEVRNDLIDNLDGQENWAERLAGLIKAAIQKMT